jgi:N-carbamoyl-L-amino-acid hydrolase
MLGSGLVTGAWDAPYVHSRVDAEGLRLGDELAAIGYLGDAAHRLREFFAALEVHIEQGTQLDEADASVGIVPVIEPVRWCSVRVTGRGGHAGGPGPEGRKEAIVAASRMVVAARNAAIEAGDFKTTVGRISAEPGSNNVIPHVVMFALDIRSGDDQRLDAKLAEVSELFSQIAADEGVSVEIDRDWSMTSLPFDQRLQSQLARTADECGVRWLETRGHIGHDSLHLAAMGPTAMLFTRTRDGISHSEQEFAPPAAVLATADVFVNAVLAIASAETLEDLGRPSSRSDS